MANTNILIKRSSTTRAPSSLAAGELAYSYQSDTLFLGNAAGNGVINVGGLLYTQTLDNATNLATGDTLVKRDATGNASFNYIFANIVGTIAGTAEQATKLTTGRDFSISGGDISATGVSFDGTGNVTLNASLNAIPGLTAGSYGSSTAIPVLDIAANGRVIGVSTASISTEFTLEGDSGSTTVAGGDTLTLNGGAGITSSVSGDSVSFDVDNTVVRSNTAITNQTIDGDITISGNLVVQGTQTVIDTVSLNVADPLIYLASENTTSDALDIGFAGKYFDGAAVRHGGVIRNAGDKEYYVFDNYDKDVTSNNEIDVADASFRKANINAGYAKVDGIISGNINLNNYIQSAFDTANTNASDITIIQGVNTAQNTAISAVDTFAQSAYNAANNSVQSGDLATVATSGSYNDLSDTPNLAAVATSGSYNDLTNTPNLATVATSGLYSDLTGTPNLATVATSGSYNDLSDTPNLASIATSGSGSDITSGTVAVSYGGTGRSTFSTNGLVYGNSTDGLLVTAAAGTSDQTWTNQILTTTNAGVPVWSSALDGGTF